MKPTKTIAYALACLKALARNPGAYLQVAEIAAAEVIPAAYCQKILLALARAGLVESLKGRGFTLHRPVESITTLEVVRALTVEDARDSDQDSGRSIRTISELLASRLSKMYAELSVAELVR